MTIEDLKEMDEAYFEYRKACLNEGKEPLSFKAWQQMPSGEFRGCYE